jgi:hypothetical protein
MIARLPEMQRQLRALSAGLAGAKPGPTGIDVEDLPT